MAEPSESSTPPSGETSIPLRQSKEFKDADKGAKYIEKHEASRKDAKKYQEFESLQDNAVGIEVPKSAVTEEVENQVTFPFQNFLEWANISSMLFVRQLLTLDRQQPCGRSRKVLWICKTARSFMPKCLLWLRPLPKKLKRPPTYGTE